jgi:ADP-ribose pyrophosphatase
VRIFPALEGGEPHFTQPNTGGWVSGIWGVLRYYKTMNKAPKTLPPKAKKVFAGEVFTVWQWPQKLFDGSEVTFEGVSRPDTVRIIGILPNRKVLLVRDHQPDRPEVLTFAGGFVDPGEDPLQAAGRELREETGYEAKNIRLWFNYCPPGRVMLEVHFFIGKDLQRIGDPQNSPGEKIELMEHTFDEFLQLGRDPELRDPMMRITLLEALLDSKKKAELEHLLYG